MRATPPWVDAAWLAGLPGAIERSADRWRLSIGDRLGRGNTSRVFDCVDDRGRRVVLKLAPPEARPDLEAAALRVWDGKGAVTLIDADADIGALLLQRLLPGTPLPPGHDGTAAALVAPALRSLASAVVGATHGFPTQLEFLEVWRGRVLGSAEVGTAGLRLLDHALLVARALCRDATRPVLLHGDFIDKNLRLGGAMYVAIDPIPRIGELASDVGFYAAYHPPARDIARRARSLARLCGVDPDRAARWAAVWAVGEATETWREDTQELQAWVEGPEAAALLGSG